ncbi:hypothetical protein MKX01_000381 [Papaver californicum]|nr:hypothetical protein MKX01_000381 [Papaver californicum]
MVQFWQRRVSRRNNSVLISALITILVFRFSLVFSSAEPSSLKLETPSSASSYYRNDQDYKVTRADSFGHTARQLLGKSKPFTYQHKWPAMTFGWRIIAGTVVGFIGAAFGSIGGVGGGGIYVPMLTLIIGFDPKTSVPISKCMITGAALSTVFYNLKRRHPTLDMPLIDYNLTLLMQPMLMLGISIGVILSEIFADWMVTVLLIVLFIAMSTMSFFKGVQTWKKETILKKVNLSIRTEEVLEGNPLPVDDPSNNKSTQKEMKTTVPILENVYWKELGLLIFVWIAFLVIQIFKNKTSTCSTSYWVLSSAQIPVSVGVTMYEAIGLYKGKKTIASLGEKGVDWKVYQLSFFAVVGVIAGTVGGLLGLGGGFIMGPLFLELGIPPQVSTATATYAMFFSSSMSVVEYYLLKRFPVPYALYFFAVATLAALVGQHVVRRIIAILGRASIIIFILVFTMIISTILLGGIGIANMAGKIEHKEYMGFEKLCH